MQRSRKATHGAVTRFFSSILPLKENDVPRLYHTPRHPRYDPETAVVEQIVLSVTGTPGVYSLIGYNRDEQNTDAAMPLRRPPRTLCFLHRPFDLDRRAVRKGTLVLSSHTSFDEVLTVGWNPYLAERLSMNVVACLCIQGYKGKAGWDPDRKIGIMGQVTQHREMLVRRIQHEFGPMELVQEGLADEIHVVAIMNAFNEEQVHRVLDTAREEGWVPPEGNGRNMLYLTGQPRIAGLDAAQAQGMSVVCVGHRQAEDWGIRYMANELRAAFPGVRVAEVYEEETSSVKPDKVHVVREAGESI
ncbi:hypothetical protein ACN47E_000554 [Coniothyrium glycines]